MARRAAGRRRALCGGGVRWSNYGLNEPARARVCARGGGSKNLCRPSRLTLRKKKKKRARAATTCARCSRRDSEHPGNAGHSFLSTGSHLWRPRRPRARPRAPRRAIQRPHCALVAKSSPRSCPSAPNARPELAPVLTQHALCACRGGADGLACGMLRGGARFFGCASCPTRPHLSSTQAHFFRLPLTPGRPHHGARGLDAG